MTIHEKYQETMLWYWDCMMKEKNRERKYKLQHIRKKLFDWYWGMIDLNLGKWKKHFDTIECPYCGHGQFLKSYIFLRESCICSPYDTGDHVFIPNYCPRCGQAMKKDSKPITYKNY